MIPQAEDAEAALVGMLLGFGEVVLARTELKAEAFYDPRRREVWGAAESLWRRGGKVDSTLVADELAARGMLAAIGGFAGLTELAERTPTADNAGHYAALVRRAAGKRRLAVLLEELKARALGDDEPGELVALAQAQLAAAVEDRGDPTRSLYATAKAVLAAKEAEIKALARGEAVARLKTGFPEVDDIMGGLVDKALNVLAGGTSHGKSALMRSIVQHLAEQGVASHVFTTEDPDEAVGERALADYADLELSALSTSPEQIDKLAWGRLAAALERIRQADRVLLDHSANMSIERIAMRVRKHKPALKTRLVVIDYLQKLADPRVRPGPGWRKDNADIALTGATRLARDEGVCVLMLSQLNRDSAREGRPPELHDLRESGEIEQQARAVLAVYRPENDAKDAAKKAEAAHRAVVRVLKNFRGRKGDADLTWDAPAASFRSPCVLAAQVSNRRDPWQ